MQPFELNFWEDLGLDVSRLYSEMELLDRRILLLLGELDETTADTLSSFIRVLNLEDRTSPIKLFINSSGGNAKAALSLFDTMEKSQAPGETFCVGRAGSVTSLLLAAGARGYRVGFPHCHINLNQPEMTPDPNRLRTKGSWNRLQF